MFSRVVLEILYRCISLDHLQLSKVLAEICLYGIIIPHMKILDPCLIIVMIK